MFEPNPDDFWRGIVLYGENQTTYKMALGTLLMNYANQSREKITLDELSEDFYNIFDNRIKNTCGKPQYKKHDAESVVEKQIRGVNDGTTTKSKALTKIKSGPLLDQVLPYFLNVFGFKPIPVNFYSVSDDKKTLELHDPLLNLFTDNQNDHYLKKINSRWGLLEYSFEKLSEAERIFADKPLIDGNGNEQLFVIRKDVRTNLSPIKDALSGYQQDRCFYCGETLYEPSHVDHVIPFKALEHNQFWNLVVAHQTCNLRKTDYLVGLHFIENLIKRNEFVIKSHLPLHKEIKADLGINPVLRRKKILDSYLYAKNEKNLRFWEEDPKYDPSKDMFYRDWIKYIGNLQ
jgi:hypothetical protein